MRFQTFLKLSLALYVARRIVRRSQRQPSAPSFSPEESAALLQKAARFLRLPSAPEDPPLVLPDGTGLQCPRTGQLYPYLNGVLSLLATDTIRTFTQKTLDTPTTAWAYDRLRDVVMPMVGLPTFPEEVSQIQERLKLKPGDVVLDLACGHGNFTIELAKRVGEEGLVIGLDLSSAMLSRAAMNVRRWGLRNVLLINGDAHYLPLAAGTLSKLNCSGGFHQMPDLSKVLSELARVGASNATLTASMFMESPNDPFSSFKRTSGAWAKLYFIQVETLRQQLASLGFASFDWFMPGGGFGYISASRS